MASIIFTLLLDTEPEVASFLLVIHQLFQMTSTAFGSNVQMTAAGATGITELCLAFLRTHSV
jgi:hypothetical protein